MKTCKIQNCNGVVWGKGVCKFHTPSPLLSPKLVLNKGKLASTAKKKQKQVDDIERMHTLFKSLYLKRGKISEISGEKISLTTMCFHHILPKQKYKEAMYDPENIIILTAVEHNNVESDMYRYEKINQRREELLKKYCIFAKN